MLSSLPGIVFPTSDFVFPIYISWADLLGRLTGNPYARWYADQSTLYLADLLNRSMSNERS